MISNEEDATMHRLAVKMLGLALLISPALLAQGTGSINGIVQDQSGAVIPGVDVTVTNTDTGISNKFMTDATGGYHVPSLIPGPYRVQAQKGGFATGIRNGVQLTVGSDLEINIALAVGQTTTQTVVTAEAPVVDTLSSTLSALVDDKVIRDLPLNGRSFDQLVALDSSAPAFRSRGSFSTYGEAVVYTANGQNAGQNMYIMDGTEMAGAGLGYQLPGGVLGVNAGVDAIQEFSVLTGSYSAQYGKKAGAIVNLATKSGTNAFHGAAYDYLRNSAMDARNFFDGAKVSARRRNQFGGALGGPIKKDSSFFFFNYEGVRDAIGASEVKDVPDANAHQGLLPCATAPTFTCNTATGLANVGVNPAVAPYLNTLFPMPNGPEIGGGLATYLGTPTQINKLGFYLARFDQRISDTDSFFVRYNFDHSAQSSPSYLTQVATQYYSAALDKDQTLTLEEKKNFSPTLINLLRFGFSRAYVASTGGSYSSAGSGLSALDFTPNEGNLGTINFTSTGNVVGAAGLSGVSVGQCGSSGACSVGDYATNTYDESDQIFKYVGKHSMSFGVQVQRNQANQGDQYATSQAGTYVFTGGILGFLEGTPSTFTGVAPGSTFDDHKEYRRVYLSSYFQDDYKVAKNLTLNLGLRYELFTAPVDAFGRMNNYGYTYNAAGEIVINSTPTIGGAAFQGNHLGFAPRFGFAWDPRGDGKTSVRGGIGLFFDQDLQADVFYLDKNPPYAPTVTVVNPSFPYAFASGAAGSAPVPAPEVLDTNWKTPTLAQWNLNIQRQVTSSSMVSIGYVGSEGYHFGRLTDPNTFAPTYLLNGQSYAYDIPGSTIYFPAGQPRINPALSGGTEFITTNMNTSYEGATATFDQRLTHGLRAKATFTKSKALSTGPGFIASYANGELGYTENPFNAEMNKGLSPYNLSYNFTTNLTYDLPGPKSGLAGSVLGGWQTTAILTRHPGTPFTVSDGFSRSGDGDTHTPDQPNYNPAFSGPIITGNPNQYFNPLAFVPATPGYFGDVGRNVLNGPGFFDLDFAIHKAFTIKERVKADLRAEAFNILNHANFDLPSEGLFTGAGSGLNTTWNYSPTAGHITDTVVTSRQIQLALKFTF
jgi:hypothetical protein